MTKVKCYVSVQVTYLLDIIGLNQVNTFSIFLGSDLFSTGRTGRSQSTSPIQNLEQRT